MSEQHATQTTPSTAPSTTPSTTSASAPTVQPVGWFEVMGQDPARLRRFYSEAFGWEFIPMADDYAMVNALPGSIPGGVGRSPGPGGWVTFYVNTDDLEAAVARAVEAGATVLMPPTEQPDVRLALVADPEGHRVGLAQVTAGA